jgi:transposase-like protein
MIPTTPAQDRYRQFSCPNLACARFNRPGEGNIAHRSWTGKHQQIQRLRCTVCTRKFSEREGTLMARSKLPEETVERVLKCQRWGVCDAGTADICGVDIKTVQSFQHVAAQRAQAHHEQVTRDLRVEAVQLDEMHSKRRGPHVEWLHTALAIGSRFVLWVHWGPRTPQSAAVLIALVVARLCGLPVWLSDGWKAYPAALLQVLGRVSQRRRRGTRGRHPKPRLLPPRDLFYGQMVKVRDGTGKLQHVVSRVVYGGPRRFVTKMACRGLRPFIHTAFMERWDGTLGACALPGAGAPAAVPRVSAVTRRGCGWWSTSTTLCCRTRVCTSRAGHAPPRWPSDWPSTSGVIETISGILCLQILSATSSCSSG